MQELHNIPEIEDIEVTAKTLEKFVNFKVKIFESNFKLDFKDSLNFFLVLFVFILFLGHLSFNFILSSMR